MTLPIGTDGYFDTMIASGESLETDPVTNLASLIFNPRPGRNEESEVFLSHDGSEIVRVSLSRLRFVTSRLFAEFRRTGLQPGATVFLASVSGSNELFIALMFTALAAYGVRTLLPMFVETGPLEDWLKLCGCASVIIPGVEIDALDGHDKAKAVVATIRDIAARKGLPCLDILSDFRLRDWLYADLPPEGAAAGPEITRAIGGTGLETEALLITTSGSSGVSKLVAYRQGAFIRSCVSWQRAGFFAPDKLGGRGFTPLFSHTMGIRAAMNAIWTGSPVCLINTEWFEEKPETVRYLLLAMRPEHITGGPAVFNLMLELMRNFPELKDGLRRDLKVLVMSGAPANGTTALAVRSAFDIALHNAFGMTETQQVLSTLLVENPRPEDLASLGRPLPGVAIGLKRWPDEPGCYKMYVNSPFGFAAVLGENPEGGVPRGFFDSGDIVRLTEGGRILYVGRESRDFFKDGFGVKIPLSAMARHYSGLYQRAVHVEYFPVRNNPGVAALIFLEGEAAAGRVVTDPKIMQDIAGLVAGITARLSGTLEPFEFRHRALRRFALVDGAAPKTVKGNISKYGIEVAFRDTIATLTDPLASGPGVVSVAEEPAFLGAFTRSLNPYIGGMLSALGMDLNYHRAKKDSLFTFMEGREVEVLDLVGGYGTNLLGHNREDLKETAVSYLAGDHAALADQASLQEEAGSLAEELAAAVSQTTHRDYKVVFGSSGSEAVEMALQHAILEWRQRIEKVQEQQGQQFGAVAGAALKAIWSENRAVLEDARVHVITLKTAFHGNSAGARALQGHDEQRHLFRHCAGFVRLSLDDRSPDWEEQLNDLVAQARVTLRRLTLKGGRLCPEDWEVGTVVAAIAEPVVGEGGVRVVDPAVLNRLGGFEFPLIMDEIQCGLGRTGTFLASAGVRADYYLFGKALGGGLEKISALLVDAGRFCKEFGKLYVSTFANGGLAAAIARRALSVIKVEGVPERAARQGRHLRNLLVAIAEAFPGVIREVTGRGLMIGIRFEDFSRSSNILLRTMGERKLAGYVFASYLLHRSRLRVLPTLSSPDMLRIEPSAFLTEEEMDRTARAFEDLARTISEGRMYDLFRPLMDGDPFLDNKGRTARPGPVHPRLDIPAGKAVQVAFIAHFSRPADELRIIEGEFSRASDTGLRILFNRFQHLLELKPFVLYAKNMFGGRIHFRFIALPADAAELERLHRLGQIRRVVARIQEGVDLAARGGATVIGLGGYASILSRNGLALVEPEGTRIVTGNTLTAASALFRLNAEIRRRSQIGGGLTLGIVGASGNIGAIVTEAALEARGLFERIILIDRRRAKLEAFTSGLGREALGGRLETSTDLGLLRRCDVIAVATNTNDPIVFPHHIKTGARVLVADVSIPSALAPQVAAMANVTTLPLASYITLPEDPDFVISSHTPRGAVFCCAAEAMLCGLEAPEVPLKGKITAVAVREMMKLAHRHGLLGRVGTPAGSALEGRP